MSNMTVKVLIYFGATSFFGWLLLLVGISTARDKKRKEYQEREQSEGIIVDYVRREYLSGRSKGSEYWVPVVEFTVYPQKYRLEYGNHMDQKKFPVGQKVTVLYDLSDPRQFHLEEDPTYNNGGRGAIKVGIIWIAACAVLTFVLAVFVGGASLDWLRYEIERIGWMLRHGIRIR